MPSTLTAPDKLGAIAAALAAAMGSIVGVSVYAHEPIGNELTLPAITIGAVTLQRSELESDERQLGYDDWRQSWPLTLLIAMHEPQEAQALARRLIGEMVEAIDLDHTLDGEAVEARMTEARAGYGPEEGTPRLIVVECEVQVISLMPRL